MTSKICLAKNHPVLNFFKFTLKKQTPLTLLVTAFSLLFCPGMLLQDANDDLIREYNLDAWTFGTCSFVIFVAAVVLVCMLLLLNFGYLFSKKAGDMYSALPFTRNQMLLTRGVSAFLGGLFLMTASYFGLAMINSLPTVNGVSVATVINTFLFMLLSLVVLSVFCLLFVICSGGYFDTIIAFCAINAAPALIVALIFGIAEESATGLAFDYYQLIYLTPIALISFKLMKLPFAMENPQNVLSVAEKTSIFTVIGLIVFGALCVIAAVKLFKVRKSETAGDAYSFKFMPIVISLLVSIVGGFIMAGILTGFSLNFNMVFWFFFVVCAILCSIAIGAITDRGFKKVKRSVVNGVISAALMTVMVIVGLYVADYAEHRIPKAENIETVYVADTEYKEHIDLAVKLHKGIIDCLEAEENDGYYEDEFPPVVNNVNNFNFEYVMKNGSVIKRHYWYRSPDMKNLHGEILQLMQTENFYTRYKACTKATYKLIEVHSHSTKFGSIEDTERSQNAVLTEQEAEQLIALFKKEMQAADISIFTEEAYGISVSGDEWCELYIPVSFTETIGFLETKFTEYADKVQ